MWSIMRLTGRITSLQDTAKINAGRTPHAFFERRAAQADAGAPKVKLVTELTTPPLPLLHITQVYWATIKM